MVLKEDIIKILSGNDEEHIKMLKIKELVGYVSEGEKKSISELMKDFESFLCDSKNAYENYQEYEPRVSELEYLGYDDQDMELHSLRKTMNEYYDEAVRLSNEADKVKEMILNIDNSDETLEVLEEIDNEYYW